MRGAVLGGLLELVLDGSATLDRPAVEVARPDRTDGAAVAVAEPAARLAVPLLVVADHEAPESLASQVDLGLVRHVKRVAVAPRLHVVAVAERLALHGLGASVDRAGTVVHIDSFEVGHGPGLFAQSRGFLSGSPPLGDGVSQADRRGPVPSALITAGVAMHPVRRVVLQLRMRRHRVVVVQVVRVGRGVRLDVVRDALLTEPTVGEVPSRGVGVEPLALGEEGGSELLHAAGVDALAAHN